MAFSVFLLLEVLQGLFVELKLLLDGWIGDGSKRLGLGLSVSKVFFFINLDRFTDELPPRARVRFFDLVSAHSCQRLVAQQAAAVNPGPAYTAFPGRKPIPGSCSLHGGCALPKTASSCRAGTLLCFIVGLLRRVCYK